MKKFAWMLAAVLSFGMAFTSCGDDDEAITLDTNNATVEYKGTVTLKASENNGAWTSDNEFVATVDQKGVVTGVHCGEATISVAKDGNVAKCKVTVTAKDQTYTLPVLDFGASMTNVENAMTSFVKSTTLSDANTLFYSASAELAYPWYIYLFNNNKLTSSSLTVDIDDELKNVDNLLDDLDQYYKQISFDSNSLKATYANANSVANASVVVVLEPTDDLASYIATFAPTSTTKAFAPVEAVVASHKAIVNRAKK